MPNLLGKNRACQPRSPPRAGGASDLGEGTDLAVGSQPLRGRGRRLTGAFRSAALDRRAAPGFPRAALLLPGFARAPRLCFAPLAVTRRLALPLALLAALSCRERPTLPPADAGSPAAFTLADLAAAAALDASLSRLSALAARYQVEIAAGNAARLRDRTARLDPLLEATAAEAAAALDRIRDPRDRALAAPLAAAAGRWPALLRQAREERLAGPPGPAAASLAALGAEVARGLEAYRRSRSGWVLSAPPEDETEVAFGQARDQLERTEAQLGASLPASPQAPGPRLDEARARGEIDMAVRRGRAAAAVVAGDRRLAAQRWVEAEARALEALLALAGSPPDPRELMARSLAYQDAKAEALSALAEYARLAAARAAR